MSPPAVRPPARRLALIVNPNAGGGRPLRALEHVRSALTGLEIDHTVALTRDIDHARALARQAGAEGDVAVGFGGDGLIGAVAGELRGTQGMLGVLPGGRGNDLARVLGIPLEPVAACEVLARGVPQRLDLGEVSGRTFIGIASCGFDSDANRIANGARLIRGNLVYAYGALRALASWRPARFEVVLDDGRSEIYTGYSVAAANSRAYGGGMMLAPEASLSDGLLDVVITGEASRLRFLRLLPTVFSGEHIRQPEVRVRRARAVTISADRAFTLYADGDPVAQLPVTITSVPAAVAVLVPAEGAAP